MKGLTLTLLLLMAVATSKAAPADTSSPAKIQPILTTLASPLTGEFVSIRMLNDAGPASYANIILDWELRADGIIRQKGSLAGLALVPHRPVTRRLPIRAMDNPTAELYLGLRYRYPKKPGAAPAPPIAEEQLLLRPWTNNQLPIHPNGELTFTDENGLFTIQSPAARLQFDKQTGWLLLYEAGGLALLADTPGLKPHFQRANLAPHLQLFSTSTGSQLVIIRAEYTLPEAACLLHLSYTVNASGEMLVESVLETDTTRQAPQEPLPSFGMTTQFSSVLDTVIIYGPKSDTIPSIYTFTNTPSRESGPWSAVRRWTVLHNGKGLQLTADSTLLTLGQPADNRLTIDQYSNPYQLPYSNHRFAFRLAPILPEEKIKSNTRK